ncbi:hypothetical protein HYQ46_009036 [Verticillium longisporum]|nr:hypothetical protein HYQ46_009036 [Verticillium longisporum]
MVYISPTILQRCVSNTVLFGSRHCVRPLAIPCLSKIQARCHKNYPTIAKDWAALQHVLGNNALNHVTPVSRPHPPWLQAIVRVPVAMLLFSHAFSSLISFSPPSQVGGPSSE